jgi:hypothetical protein
VRSSECVWGGQWQAGSLPGSLTCLLCDLGRFLPSLISVSSSMYRVVSWSVPPPRVVVENGCKCCTQTPAGEGVRAGSGCKGLGIAACDLDPSRELWQVLELPKTSATLAVAITWVHNCRFPRGATRMSEMVHTEPHMAAGGPSEVQCNQCTLHSLSCSPPTWLITGC